MIPSGKGKICIMSNVSFLLKYKEDSSCRQAGAGSSGGREGEVL